MKAFYPIGTKKYIVFRREVIELTYKILPQVADAPLWFDEHNCLWALAESGAGIDKNNGAGVGIFRWYSWLPWAKKLNYVATFHDYAYSCPAFQVFHKRSEADSYLKYLIKINAQGDGSEEIAQTFKQLSREFGGPLWENEATNN